MPRYIRLIVLALSAAALLAAGTGMATASRGIRLEPTALTATARRLTFADGSGTFRVVCEWRFTISLHRTVAKSRGTLAGLVTAADVRSCAGGNFRALAATLPWHITYDSFRGTLPTNVAGLLVTINNFSWLQEAFFGVARCLYAGNLRLIAEGRENRYTRLTAELRDITPLFSELLSPASCPESGRYEGTFELSSTFGATLI